MKNDEQLDLWLVCQDCNGMPKSLFIHTNESHAFFPIFSSRDTARQWQLLLGPLFRIDTVLVGAIDMYNPENFEPEIAAQAKPSTEIEFIYEGTPSFDRVFTLLSEQ